MQLFAISQDDHSTGQVRVIGGDSLASLQDKVGSCVWCYLSGNGENMRIWLAKYDEIYRKSRNSCLLVLGSLYLAHVVEIWSPLSSQSSLAAERFDILVNPVCTHCAGIPVIK